MEVRESEIMFSGEKLPDMMGEEEEDIIILPYISCLMIRESVILFGEPP